MAASLQDEFLKKVDALIDERLRLDEIDKKNDQAQLLKASCRHLCISQHAKRARPLLCLYYHLMYTLDIGDELTKIAVAAEFIHAASLLHDDIVDEAERRRGKFSANMKFGNAVAVLAGDFLLTEAFDLLRALPKNLTDQAILVVRQMTKAAILELTSRGKVGVSCDLLRNIAIGKTGVLFSWCGFAVSHLLDRSSHAAELWAVGERIGVIFQMADDLKDFSGDNGLKDRLSDMKNFEPSIPVVLAMEKNPSFRRKIEEIFSTGIFDESQSLALKNAVIESGGVQETKKLMAAEFGLVEKMLKKFDGTLGKSLLDAFMADLTATDVLNKNKKKASTMLGEVSGAHFFQ